MDEYYIEGIIDSMIDDINYVKKMYDMENNLLN